MMLWEEDLQGIWRAESGILGQQPGNQLLGEDAHFSLSQRSFGQAQEMYKFQLNIFAYALHNVCLL